MEKTDEDELLSEEPIDYAFQALSGVRESASIFKRMYSQVPYEAAFDIVHELDPEAYDRFVELIEKRNKSDEVRYYLEKAEALSTEDKPVTPTELIEKDLLEVESAITKKKGKAPFLFKRKINLIAAIKYFEPRKVSEHKILNRDFYLKGIKLPEALEIYKDESFVDYKLSGDRYLRLRLLHPDKEEEILGSDLIYEQFDLENEKVRFIHVQFKVWGKNGLYFSQGNMSAQIDKVCDNLCESGYCKSKAGSNSPDGFRMPYCSGFLRPTDKQINNEKDMSSTGIHIPACYIRGLFGKAKKLTKEDAKSNGLSNAVFGELFVNGFIGSRWMPINELEEFYRKRGIDDHINSIRVHAQEVYVESESKRVMKSGR